MSENTNYIYLSGVISSPPEFSHSIYGENFYRLFLSVKRLSGVEDTVPVTVSERILPSAAVEIGTHFSVIGQVRSYNQRNSSGSKLIITVFAREMIQDTCADRDADCNECELLGFICKPVIYRTTPFSREISDVLLAVNRNYGKSDYLPCIAWGRNARYLNKLTVGSELSVIGRLQSRDYKKLLDNGEIETRIAYEISCSSLELIERDKNSI